MKRADHHTPQAVPHLLNIEYACPHLPPPCPLRSCQTRGDVKQGLLPLKMLPCRCAGRRLPRAAQLSRSPPASEV